MALLDKVKVACRVASTDYDNELTDLISAAFDDLGITDISVAFLTEETITPLIQRAVITYCKMNFGYATLTEDQYARLKESYDEQKAQMLMSSQYNSAEGGGSETGGTYKVMLVK